MVRAAADMPFVNLRDQAAGTECAFEESVEAWYSIDVKTSNTQDLPRVYWRGPSSSDHDEAHIGANQKCTLVLYLTNTQSW
jgi:hypothetical protein